MSIIAITFWLLVQGLALAFINLFGWRMLARWFGGEGKPNTFAFTVARLSILLTFNAWLTAAILYTEGRSVWMGPEMAPIHWFMTWGQGAAMLVASTIISLLSPFIVIAAFVCGGIAVISARGGKDSRSVWLGWTGMGFNGLLLLGACAWCGSGLFFRGGRTTKPSQPAVAEKLPDEANDREPAPPHWSNAEQVDRFAAHYEQRGYQRIVDSSVSIREEITDKTIIFASHTTINAPVQADLVLVSNVASIRDDVNGDVKFYGQVLTIDKDSMIHGNLHIVGASVVNVNGEVTGEITGDNKVITGLSP